MRPGASAPAAGEAGEAGEAGGVPYPDIVRAAYAELVVTDLAASREFYVDLLGLVVTHEDADAIHLRAFDEYLHHSLVLRRGAVAALAALAYRVRTPHEVDVAERYYRTLGVPVERRAAGATRGIGPAVRVEDPLGFPVEFFYEAVHVERLNQRYDLHGAGAIARLDHFNIVVPDVARAERCYRDLGFRVTEDIRGEGDTLYASWLHRKDTVHDIALTGGDGPRLHHIAFSTYERAQVLHVCDLLGAWRRSAHIERGPGRHGVSNAFYVYVRDPDGHRVEIYTTDYYTGDPDHPVLSWDVRDNQRRDWWGNPVVPSWYAEASPVLDLAGKPRAVVARAADHEADVTVGADGFSYANETAADETTANEATENETWENETVDETAAGGSVDRASRDGSQL
ncbi:3,4-dihydroxyphenylacetate 2,3-dioxygenase [Streptomyces sp. SID3343]|uniref:3,4-dihydroxyphenylacetate 2,3-dioxygenase n=1 Tax=Streptomyces sp. SID3343 TaxID=2690260 RepID=UPI00136E0905|nr:3,4-dihydroxyphenylacetate 2,3-dioxygenase [Streptomyces sp. SID3343]